MKNKILIVFLLLIFDSIVYAEDIVSFDSASEMSYWSDCASTGLSGSADVLEENSFRMQDGYLRMDTVTASSSVVIAAYRLLDKVDSSRSWTFEARVKEIEIESDQTSPVSNFIQGFGLAVHVDGFLYRMALGDGTIYGFSPTTSAQPTADDFHIYTMSGSPNSLSYDVYRDGQLIFTETARPTIQTNSIMFGDPTCHGGNSKFLIDSVVFSQQNSIGNVLQLFDQLVADGTLVGLGQGKSATGRLNALRDMILSVSDLIDTEDSNDICDQISAVIDRIDGIESPPDFVEGAALEDLFNAMSDLAVTEECNLI